jgi:hypothetical protein
MRRSGTAVALAGSSLLALLLFGACGSPPSRLLDAGAPDAALSDAGPTDAALAHLGPALVFDTIALTGQNIVFGTLGDQLLNAQMAAQIEAGQFLLVIELRGLDDPAGQSDDSVDLGFYNTTDSDEDLTDNFDAENPETLLALGVSLGPGGEPLIVFSGASITSGRILATGLLDIPIAGVPLPLQDATVEGRLVAAPDDLSIYYLDDSTLSGSVPASILALVPNLLTDMCTGGNMLDVMITSCGILPVSQQPDVDLDGDGLERFYDTGGAGDAGVPDGVIDLCVDGDGTEVPGEQCWSDSRFADGYLMVFDLHGTRVLLAVEQ